MLTIDLVQVDPLTPREEQVARLIAQGYGNKAIADSLGIKVRSVDTYVSGLREAWLFPSDDTCCRKLAIECYKKFHGTHVEGFEQGALAQRERVLLEIERLRALDTVGTEAKQVLGRLEQGLREGMFTPEYGGRE